MRAPFVLSALLLAACEGEVGNSGPDHQVILVGDGGGLHETSGPPDGSTPPAEPGPSADLTPAGDAPSIPPDLVSPPHDIGKTCTGNADCMFKICAQNTHTGQMFCTKVCDPCATSPCPAGSGCQNAGLAYICAPGYPNAPCP